MNGDTISARTLFRAISSRPLVVLTVTLLTVAVAAFVLAQQQPTYSAVTQLLIDYDDPRDVGATRYAGTYRPEFMETRVGIIRSQRVAATALEYLEGRTPRPADVISRAPYVFGDNSEILDQVLRDSGADVGNAGGSEAGREALAALLLDKIIAEVSEGSRIIQISTESSNPAFAASLVNAFAQGFIDTHKAFDQGPMAKSALFMEEQVAELREALLAAQSRMSEYQSEKGIMSLDDRADIDLSYIESLSRQLVDAKASVAASKGRVANLERALRSGQRIEAIPDVVSNRLVQDLKVDISRKEAELQEISGVYGEKHPVYVSTLEEIRQLRSNIEAEMQSIVEAQRNQLRVANSRERELAGALAEERQRQLVLRQERNLLPIIKNEVDQAQRAYDAALEEKQRFELLGRSEGSDVVVLSYANTPEDVAAMGYIRPLALATLLGLILGIFGALVMNSFDDRVRDPDDIETLGLDLAVLAEVPRG